MNNLAPMKNCPGGCKVTLIGCRGIGILGQMWKLIVWIPDLAPFLTIIIFQYSLLK